MAQLRQLESRFNQLDVAVAVVTFDADTLAMNYVRQTGLEWPLLIDQQRKLYRAYHMDRASWWSIYGPASVWHYLKLLVLGRRLHRPGRDWRQVGGDVVIDPQGIVRFHFVSSSPHDRPTTTEILSVIGHPQRR